MVAWCVMESHSNSCSTKLFIMLTGAFSPSKSGNASTGALSPSSCEPTSKSSYRGGVPLWVLRALLWHSWSMNRSNKQDKGRESGKGKQNGSPKGKEKGCKGGRKGKLNELSNELTWNDEPWWTDDSGWWWYEPGVEQVSYWSDHDWSEQTWDGQ